ncbi:bifunctional metallophosphatase/5'-nucleotidase [Nocardioides sp. NPDC057767]|uniref:bifunctional metallophosphatase/5'-nucleotidase n=1 Tax=unclassified Nocardioides TaxID=2615069 RepID=UPI00366DB270
MAAGAAMALGLAVMAPAEAKDGPKGGATVEISVLQYSDWHGAISTAPQFAALLDQERAAHPNSLLLTGGDDFGGTEPVSSLNDDIPAIEVQNAFGLDAGGIGNHNFDGGIQNFQEKIDLADYPYLSANLAGVEDNLTGVKPYEIFEFASDVKVAVIGFTNEEAPTLTFPGNLGTIEITDAATALMAARTQAAAEGADIFVALGHKGVRSFDADGNPHGELIDLAEQLHGFDMVLGDHTDVEYIGEINGAIVSETESHGHGYNRITLDVKPGSGKIVRSSVEPVEIDPEGPADPEIEALVAPYYEALAEKFDGVIGRSGGFWNRGSGSYERIGEAELGNLFADATLASAPNADIALTNSGGIRSSLSPSNYTVSDPTVDRDGNFPDDVVVGDLFSLHNFGNIVTTQNVTGSQLRAALEHGVGSLPGANGAFPQIAGFQVVFDSSLPAGSRVLAVTRADGTPIADTDTLVLATNNFLSAGGDGYEMLADPNATTLGLLTSALGDFISNAGLVTPYFDCRVVDQNPNGAAAQRAVNPLGTSETREDCA